MTGWETGLRVPSEAIINSICREFHVSEHWLRTGEGDIEVSTHRDDEIDAFINKVLHSQSVDFRRRLVTVLARLDVEEWKLLENMALKLANEVQKEAAPKLNILKIAGRDGSFTERAVTDDELADLQAKLEQLPDASDDL